MSSPSSSAVASRTCLERAEAAAVVLRRHAAEVDLNGCFPAESMAELQRQGLLGLLVPAVHGGLGGDLADLVAVARVLGAACQSTAMIWVMHCQQVEVLVRHGSPALQARVLRRVTEEGHYLASVTTEPGKGGRLLAANAGLAEDDGLLSLDRQAPVVTGGAHAGGFLVTMRDTGEAAATQVTLLYADRSELTVEPVGCWNAMGMRGTESHGYRLAGALSADSVVGERGGFRRIAVETLIPVSHLGWAACWLGAAHGATAEVVSAIRSDRRPSGVDPSSPLHLERLGRIRMELELAGAYLAQVTGEVLRRRSAGLSMDDPATQIQLNTVKVASAELAFSVVDRLMKLVGLSMGYLRTSSVPIERYFRDLRSATLNNADDKLVVATGSLSLLDRAVTLAGTSDRRGSLSGVREKEMDGEGARRG